VSSFSGTVDTTTPRAFLTSSIVLGDISKGSVSFRLISATLGSASNGETAGVEGYGESAKIAAKDYLVE